METLGRLALNRVLWTLLEGRMTLRVSGNLILLSWNWIVLARLHLAAGTMAGGGKDRRHRGQARKHTQTSG